MDYLLDRYVWDYIPYTFTDETRKSVSDWAMHIVQLADWVCKYQEPSKIYENHTSFLFGELLFFFLCACTLCHAYRHGGRLMYVWIGILIHSLNVENLCYWIPDLDNFWQAQGILTFFGARAPLYIILGIYHMFDYTAYVMVSRLRLPWWAEGPAVGLCAVMLDMPYDIMGIKLVWWTWHDTDPNIYDRMYWVPWNSYYFHAAFACSFVWLLKLSRRYLVTEEYDWKKFPREFLCSFIAGTGAFWVGTMQFVLLYHPLHDVFKVHSEITTVLFLCTYIVIVVIADRHNKNPEARAGNKYWFDELACAIAVEYLFYMILVLVADPHNIVADGLHQAIGPCNETQKVQTPTGLVLHKGKYLCADNYDEGYFDFHCLPNGGNPPNMPEDGSPLEWYAICGTDFENRAEYIAIIWGICILYGTIFYQMAARSGPTPKDKVKIYPTRTSPRKTPTAAVKSPEAKKDTTPLLKSKKTPLSSPVTSKVKTTTSTFTAPKDTVKKATAPPPPPPKSVSTTSQSSSEEQEENDVPFKTPLRRGRRPTNLVAAVTPGFVPEATPSRILRNRKAANYKV